MRLTLKIWHLPLFLILFLTGCDNGGPHKMYVSTQAKEEKRFTVNPHPQQHYQMTITIENAPGTFERLKTFAHYRALNCHYILRGPAGATAQPDKNIPLHFKKISDTQYQGDFYVDAMLDEDYYGNGLCEWSFINVIALFSATEAKEDTLFRAFIMGRDLDKKNLEFNHLTEYYPKTKNDNGYLSQGVLRNISRFKPEEYFTFYVEIEEIE